MLTGRTCAKQRQVGLVKRSVIKTSTPVVSDLPYKSRGRSLCTVINDHEHVLLKGLSKKFSTYESTEYFRFYLIILSLSVRVYMFNS